jgi:hypothetical protein
LPRRPFAAATEPAVAIFGSFDYVASTNGGSDCGSVGAMSSGRLTWPGAAKPGAVWRYQLNGAAGPFVKEVTYPKTPKPKAAKWSGTEKVVIEPSGATSSATFEATITYINADSFVMERTVSFGNCTQTIFSSLVRD